MGFDEALGLSSMYGVLEVGCGVMLILVFWEIGLWTCGYGGVTESTESPLASSSLSFLFVIFSIILIKLSFSLLLSGCKRNCAFMI